MLTGEVLEVAKAMQIGEVRYITTPRGCLQLYKFQYWDQLCRASEKWRRKIRRVALTYPDSVVEVDPQNCVYVQIRVVDCRTKLPVANYI
jgi:hypothetical protein